MTSQELRDKQKAAVQIAVELIRQTLIDAGQDGIPKGMVYAVFQEHGLPLQVFNQIIEGMAEVGALHERNHVLYMGAGRGG